MLSWLVSSGLSLSIVLRTGTKRDLSSPPWSVTNYMRNQKCMESYYNKHLILTVFYHYTWQDKFLACVRGVTFTDNTEFSSWIMAKYITLHHLPLILKLWDILVAYNIIKFLV
jgi:hypothetical protein